MRRGGFWMIGVLLIVFFTLFRPYLVSGKGQLITLTENTWQELLEGEWMVEFFAPWCPACKQLEPLWKEFSEWSEDLSIKVGNIDVTSNPALDDANILAFNANWFVEWSALILFFLIRYPNHIGALSFLLPSVGLSGRFMVTALPTIYHVKEGVFRQYRGARDKEAFFSFVEEKKWSSIEPIPGWKSPQSYQMSVVSYFFKLSMGLRAIHNTMVEDYGIPYWGSYILFGLATILIGAILGLIIVCIIDFICPTKPLVYQPVPQASDITPESQEQNEEQEDVYEEEDVIKDVRPEQELRKRVVDSDQGSGDI